MNRRAFLKRLGMGLALSAFPLPILSHAMGRVDKRSSNIRPLSEAKIGRFESFTVYESGPGVIKWSSVSDPDNWNDYYGWSESASKVLADQVDHDIMCSIITKARQGGGEYGYSYTI